MHNKTPLLLLLRCWAVDVITNRIAPNVARMISLLFNEEFSAENVSSPTSSSFQGLFGISIVTVDYKLRADEWHNISPSSCKTVVTRMMLTISGSKKSIRNILYKFQTRREKKKPWQVHLRARQLVVMCCITFVFFREKKGRRERTSRQCFILKSTFK